MIPALNRRLHKGIPEGALPMSKSDNFDRDCLDLIDDNINMSVPWYIMASYAYYVLDDPILTDSTFDRLCNKMLDKWDEIVHHHKEYVTKENLYAGTYLGKYPSRVHGATESLTGKRYGKQNVT